MAVEIKSGNSTDLGTVDPISKALRVTTYNSEGIEGSKEVPVLVVCFPITTAGNDLISSLDVTQYKSISLQLTGIWVGTVTFQGSNDNGTFYDIVAQNTSSVVTPYTVSSNTLGLFNIPVIYKYFRARVTVITSGTVTGSAYGHKEDKNINSVGQIGVVTLAPETTKIIGTVNVAPSQSSATGTIIAADTAVAAPSQDGSLRTGVPSVGSTVVINAVAQDSSWVVEITGALGGATFYFEGTTSSTNGVDGNWTAINGRQTKTDTTLSTSTTSAGVFRGNLSGMDYFRVRAISGVAITALINIRIGQGSGAVFLNASLPEGTNEIGSIGNIQKLGGQDVAMGSGSVTAGTQRITIATGTSLVLGSGNAVIGKVTIAPGDSLIPLFILGQSGAINVNSGSVKASAGTLRVIVFTNYAATPRHFKVYNTASVPSAGVGIPSLVCSLPAAGTLVYPLPVEGFAFSNGIGYTMTLGAANNDVTTTATAPDFSVSLVYS
jgi:hypothetical protein